METIDEGSFLKQSLSSNGQQTDQFSCSGEENEDEEDDMEEGDEEEDEVEYSSAIDLHHLEDQDYKERIDDDSQNAVIDPLETSASIFSSVTTEGSVLTSDGTGSAAALQMAMPLSTLTPSLASGQELVIISPDGGIMKIADSIQLKPAMPTFSSVEDEEPDSKRLLVEQDGQTYILTLPGGITSGLDMTQQSAPSVVSTTEVPLLLNQEDEESSSSVGTGGQSDINQAWFTSREDKSNLQSKGHVWKQGMWSKEETDLLEANILSYCEERGVSDPALVIFEMTKDDRKDFYRSVAKGLNRPLFSVYRRVIRMYDNKNHVGKYTSEELDKLKKLRSMYGNNWQAIGAALGRSASSIKDRCRLMKDNCNQGKWFPEEERRLAEAVYDLAQAVPGEMISSGLSWALVAERVSTRSEKQCRTKWLNYLNWKEAQGTEWTREDDITLVCRIYGLDATDENCVDWSELSKNWPSVRSPQWLRGKWWALKRHVPPSCNFSFQEMCEYLFRNQVQKVHLKEDEPDVPTSPSAMAAARALPLTLIRRNSDGNVSRDPSVSCPTATLTTQPTIIPALGPGLTGLLGDLSSIPGASSSLVAGSGTTPLLQTLEVLGATHQGLHITAPSPAGQTTFLLTQPTIPLTTAHGQIIIQTLTPEESMSVQLTNPAATQLIISNGCHPMTSLTSTEPTLATLAGSPCPPSPSSVQDIELQASHNSQHPSHHVALLDHVAYVHHHNHCIEEEEKPLIMDDPMMAGSNSPEMLHSDIESRDVSKS